MTRKFVSDRSELERIVAEWYGEVAPEPHELEANVDWLRGMAHEIGVRWGADWGPFFEAVDNLARRDWLTKNASMDIEELASELRRLEARVL